MDRTDRVRAYYRALDDGAYDRLQSLLAPSFVHDRPDRTFEGRAAFLSFMRSDRPRTDTSHPIEAVYAGPEGVVAVGQVVADDESVIARFADQFAFGADGIVRIDTYTR